MENPKKIAAILAQLNGGANKKGPWIAAEGFHAFPVSMPGTGANGSGGTVDTNNNAIVKIFFNSETGEMKPYLFRNVV